MIFETLAIPLVKTVTRACPAGKSVTGTEVNEVSDQLLPGSVRRNRIRSLSRPVQLHQRVVDGRALTHQEFQLAHLRCCNPQASF